MKLLHSRMKINLALIALGVVFGIVSANLFAVNKQGNISYHILDEDCEIATIGTLRKGAKLRYIESTSEGITRYSLYLNTKGLKLSPYKVAKDDMIIPYWLFKSE